MNVLKYQIKYLLKWGQKIPNAIDENFTSAL